MPVRRAFWLLGSAAVASWLLQPALAQDGEAIPQDLRIIEDLPEIAEDQDNDTLQDDAIADGERREDGPVVLDGGAGTLFDEDYSLLFAPPDETPAERLLPGEEDRPAVDLDPRSLSRERDRDVLPDGPQADDPLTPGGTSGDGVTGRQDPVTGPEPSGPRTGSQSRGTRGGGSGSLF